MADGFPTFLYIGDCTSQISGELEAEFKPPIGSVSNAVKMDNQKSSKLIIYSGRFVSPLSKIFDSPSNEQTLVLFDLWDFYKTSPEYNDNIYYLREFKGIAIKHFSSSSEVLKLDVNASANIGIIPLTSIKGKTSFNESVQNLFDSKDWKTLIFPDFDEIKNPRESFFEPYKNIDYIQNYFLQNVTVLEEGAPIMKQGAIYSHELFIEGFPAEKSQNNYWELDSISNNIFQDGTIKVFTEYTKNQREKEGCKIIVTGMPKSSNFATNTNNDVPVYYRFRNKDAFAINNQTLKVEFRNGIIQTNKAPRLNYEPFIEAEKVSIQGDTIVKFKWTINPIVLDKGNEINRDILPSIDTFFVQGNDTLEVSVIGNTIIQINRQTNEYQLSLLSDNGYLINSRDGYVETKKYNLNIALWITLEHGRRVKKTISTILSMPESLKPLE